MNAFTRFLSLGLRDADRRVGAALMPPPLQETDRYLRESRMVTAIDRVTVRLRDWLMASESGRLSRSLVESLRGSGQVERNQSIAVIVLSAVSVHVLLTLVQGPRAGWFWLVIPSLAAVFALLLAASSRNER